MPFLDALRGAAISTLRDLEGRVKHATECQDLGMVNWIGRGILLKNVYECCIAEKRVMTLHPEHQQSRGAVVDISRADA